MKGVPVPVFDDDVDGDGTAFTFNMRFPGQYFDQESRLYYNYFRDYEPGTGRYVQSDPIGLDGGWNTFIYVGNSPVNFEDFFGLRTYDWENAVYPPTKGCACVENCVTWKEVGHEFALTCSIATHKQEVVIRVPLQVMDFVLLLKELLKQCNVKVNVTNIVKEKRIVRKNI